MNGIQASPLSIQITFSFGKPLRQSVDDPVGHVDHVVEHEAERMDRDEAVHHRHRLVVPVIGGMEPERQAVLFQQRIGLHVGVVMHRPVARRRHHEADHAGLAGEFLHHAERRCRIVERQIQHRADARLLRQHALDQPAVIGARQRDLHLDLRMERRAAASARERSPRCRCPSHPSSACVSVTSRCSVPPDLLHLAHRIAQHAPADVLIADAGRQHAGALRPPLCAALSASCCSTGSSMYSRISVEQFEFVVMRIHIDDRKLVVAALGRLLRGMRRAAWWYRIPRPPSCG